MFNLSRHPAGYSKNLYFDLTRSLLNASVKEVCHLIKSRCSGHSTLIVLLCDQKGRLEQNTTIFSQEVSFNILSSMSGAYEDLIDNLIKGDGCRILITNSYFLSNFLVNNNTMDLFLVIDDWAVTSNTRYFEQGEPLDLFLIT